MDGIAWTASAMQTARQRLEIAARNLANASTDGFRKSVARIALTAHGLVAGTSVSREQGALRQTGRALDLAIVGEGSFRVGNATTRNGAFVRDEQGYLADDRGRRVHGAGGFVRVAADGTLLDRIPLPAASRVVTGALESPNVNAAGEMVAVLDAQRAFETAQKTLVSLDESRAKAANDVARLR